MGRNKKSKEKFNKKIVPLLVLMAVPLIMYAQNIVYDEVLTSPALILKDSYMDLFNFYKSIAMYIIAVLSIILYFLYTKKRDMTLQKNRIKYYIPLLIYTLFIILSTIFSVFPRIAIWGVYDRFEGALTLISYIVMMVYAIEVIKNNTDIKYILKAFLLMCFTVAVIGALQRIGYEPLKSGLFKFLLGLPSEIDIVTHFGNSSYSTLYNPNNAGQFAAMTLPVSLSLIFALKNKKWKIFAGLTTVLLAFLIYGSDSANAYFGVAFALILFVILFFSNIYPKEKKNKIILFGAIGLIVCIVAVGVIIKFDDIINSRSVQKEILAFKPEEDDMYLYDIIVEDKSIEFVTNIGSFYLVYHNSGISMLNGDRLPIKYRQDDRRIIFTEEPYSKTLGVEITSTNTLTVSFKRAGDVAKVDVVFDEDNFIGIRGTGGQIVHDVMENQMPENLRGYETTFSRRGYLWFVTIDRLDEVFFIGAGPDNFLYWFEQHDILGKVNLNHRAQILADKPHNLYLQIASQTGVISLIAWLVLIGTYFISTLKAIGLRPKKDFREIIAGGILCGVTGYLGASMFVDSSIGVSVIFYSLLGIGIFIVLQMPVKKKTKKKKLESES